MSWEEVWRIWVATYVNPRNEVTFRDANRVFDRIEGIGTAPEDPIAACALLDRLCEDLKMEGLL